MRNLNDIFNLYTSAKCSDHMDIAVECIIDGNDGCAYDHLHEALYDEMSLIQNHFGGEFYRFTAIPKIKGCDKVEDNPVIRDILTNSLTFSNSKNFNDPMDPILKVWFENRKKESTDKSEKKLYKMLNDVLNTHLRMSCLISSSETHKKLVKTYCHPLMWAHYADSHHGLCIQYDLSEDVINTHNDANTLVRMCDIRYRVDKVLSDYITLDNALLAKADCWEYEHETRLMCYKKDNRDWKKSRKVNDYVTLPEFPIKAVYLGCRIDSTIIAYLKKELSSRNIPLFIMRFRKDDLTKMEAVRVS